MRNFDQLADDIKLLAKSFGFQDIAVTDTNLDFYFGRYLSWLKQSGCGDMSYLMRYLEQRAFPIQLVPDTIRIISARMDYLPPHTPINQILDNPNGYAYISRYALGRDYHKLMRKRLSQFAKKIVEKIGPFGYRAFVDSAPVLEKPIAEKSGIGWIGKNTLIINKSAGSWFFLGEIFTDLPLPIDIPATNHCGSCQACIDICPTKAIVAPYQLAVERCISYLTIEHKSSIPIELRPLIGNRIFGCDDCQLVCPWNKFAKHTNEKDFHPRHPLDNPKLIDLFQWTEPEYLKKTEGSALRRVGYIGWLRNIAIALGNANYSEEIIQALQQKANHESELVREHVQWAIENNGVKD